jgi:PAS domain S-box-containing protein
MSMAPPKLRKLYSPYLILGFFIADFLLVVWLLISVRETAHTLLAGAAVVMGVLGLMLFNRMAVQTREVNQALEHGEEYIERVADLSQDIHAIIDVDTQTYVYMNQAVEKLLGYTPEEFIQGGMVFFQDLVHPDDKRIVSQQWERLLEPEAAFLPPRDEEKLQEEIYRIRNKWNEYRWFRSRRVVFARHADGRPWEILVVVHDITEQRSYEAALVHAHEFESLGLLARRLAHDLNNILMAIQGYADLGLETKDPAKIQENFTRIGESTERASKLCQQMLAYAGRGRVHITRHQLNDSVREGLPLVESLMPENVNLVLELENDLPRVNADPNQIRYAMLNLVVNAMEALGNQQGEIAITTIMKHLDGSNPALPPTLIGDYVCLEVRDTGQGMSEETLSGIFDPFFSTKHPGRGLGMLTVQGIAREHQGALQAESSPGTGSTFRIFFPVAEKEPEIADEGDEATPVVGGPGLILLVDDEPTIRSILRQGLENAGFKVIEAADGVDGFGAFVRHRSSIRLVLLDLTMPRMGGDEVFAEIRRVAPEVPVVLMSGYSQQEATAALKGKGLAGFLAKPCSVREALAVVHRVLGHTADRPE